MTYVAALIAYFVCYEIMYLFPIVLLQDLLPEKWSSFLQVPIMITGLSAFILVLGQANSAASHFAAGDKTFWQAHQAAHNDLKILIKFFFGFFFKDLDTPDAPAIQPTTESFTLGASDPHDRPLGLVGIRGVQDFEILCQFQPSRRLPYGGALIFLPLAAGKIKEMSKSLEGHLSHGMASWLTLEDKLLYGMYMDCPTCSQLLKAGNYPSDKHQVYLQKIRDLGIEEIKKSPVNWLSDFYPFLHLLEPGLYFIALTPYYPVDGEGHFFWDAFPALENSHALQWAVKDPFVEIPHFLIPTQSADAFDPVRFENAFQWLGKRPGVAYHISGPVSALLDGHHRATAAAKQGISFDCITISSHILVRNFPDGKKLDLPFLGEVKLPEWLDVIEMVQKEKDELKQREAKQFKQDIERSWPGNKPGDLAGGLGLDVSDYPRIEEIIALKVFSDPDPGTNPAYCARDSELEERWILPLYNSRNPDKYKALIQMARTETYRFAWFKLFSLLAETKSDEVAELFIDYLKYDREKRQEFINLIGKYLGSEKFTRLRNELNASWRVQ